MTIIVHRKWPWQLTPWQASMEIPMSQIDQRLIDAYSLLTNLIAAHPGLNPAGDAECNCKDVVQDLVNLIDSKESLRDTANEYAPTE